MNVLLSLNICACMLFHVVRSELFLFHSQVKFSSMLHKRIPAEASINVICASPGIVDTNVVSSISISYFFLSFVLFYEVNSYNMSVCPMF